MKKIWLTCAGIISALILTGMFTFVLLIPVFFSPVITFNPITDRNLDKHNRLILTGTTTLPAKSFIAIKVDPSFPNPAQKTVFTYPMAQGYVQVIPNGGKNLWKGIVDLSGLQPAEYTMTLVTHDIGDNFAKTEIEPLATRQFILGDEKSGPGSIRKKTVAEQPFIRINIPDAIAPGTDRKIAGTTSLEPGTSLKWRLDAASPGIATPAAVVEGVTQIGRGTEGVNRWSFVPNVTNPLPAYVRVTVTGNAGQSALGPTGNEVSGTAEFDLNASGTHGTNSGHAPGFITIDSLPDIRQNGVYVISGTTSLPPGDELSFIVLPYSSGTEIDLMIDPVTKAQVSRNPYSGTRGMVKVVQGDSKTNLWAFQLETYLMEPGTYAVEMNNDEYDFRTGSLVSKGLNTTRVFTLQEQLS